MTRPDRSASPVKPLNQKARDAVTSVTTLFSLGLEKKDKERTERGRASPGCIFRVPDSAESASRSSPRHQANDFKQLCVTRTFAPSSQSVAPSAPPASQEMQSLSWPDRVPGHDAACRKTDEWERGDAHARVGAAKQDCFIFPIFLMFSPVKSGREI